MEKEQIFNLKRFIITSVCGFLGCLFIGLIFFQSFIFYWSPMKFIFILLGLAGALVFSSLLYLSVKESLFFLVIVFLINIIVLKTHIISFIIRDIVLLGSFWLSIYIYITWFYNASGKYKRLRAFGLGVISAILILIAGIFLIFVNVPLERITMGLIFQISLYYLQSGMLIGLGLGLGFDLAEYIMIKFNLVELVE